VLHERDGAGARACAATGHVLYVLYDNFLKAVFGAQGKVAAAFGRLRPTAAGCVQVGACCVLMSAVDLEADARYELVTAVALEVDARLPTEQGGATQL
jgi:hypothetical protein